MSLFTYTLLCALYSGTSGQFTPNIISEIFQTCLLTQFLEALVAYLCLRALIVRASFLDLLSFAGYKYFGLCINALVGLLLPSWLHGTTKANTVCFFYTAMAASYFTLKVMSNTIPRQVSFTGGPKRAVIILALAISQPLVMCYVSHTRFL